MKPRSLSCFLLCLFILGSSAAEAQWVMIGRKSLGAIRNLQSEHADVATVLLEAPADKVYTAAVKALGEAQGIRITNRDDATMTLDFMRGSQPAKMQASRIEDKVSMITVTSAGTIRKTGDASLVVDGILRVCNKMGVECKPR